MAAATSPRRTQRWARRVLHVIAPPGAVPLVAATVELAAVLMHLPLLAHLLTAVVVHLLVVVWP